MSEIIKVSELKNGVSGIYKLNYPNGKIYIGLSNDIKRRISEHNCNSHQLLPPCDAAIKKYGRFDYIEILEYVNDTSLLEEREIFWIKYYNANDRKVGYNLTPGGHHLEGENNPLAIFSNSEVLDIRKRRYFGERKIDVYNNYYSDKNFSTFEKIWLGVRYCNVGKEFLIPTNSISRQEYSSKANSGENNGRAKTTEKEVREIRKRYDSGEMPSIIKKDFPNISLSTVRKICRRETWKNVI